MSPTVRLTRGLTLKNARGEIVRGVTFGTRCTTASQFEGMVGMVQAALVPSADLRLGYMQARASSLAAHGRRVSAAVVALVRGSPGASTSSAGAGSSSASAPSACAPAGAGAEAAEPAAEAAAEAEPAAEAAEEAPAPALVQAAATASSAGLTEEERRQRAADRSALLESPPYDDAAHEEACPWDDGTCDHRPTGFIPCKRGRFVGDGGARPRPTAPLVPFGRENRVPERQSGCVPPLPRHLKGRGLGSRPRLACRPESARARAVSPR